MIRSDSRAPAGEGGAHWLAILDTYQVQFLILDAEQDLALLDAARQHPAWTVDYEDGDTVLLAHPSPQGAP